MRALAFAALAWLAATPMLCAGQARAATASIYYTYDPLGRVITARYDNGTCIVYAYDAAGNRTAQTNSFNAGPETPTWGTGTWGCFLWTAQHAALTPAPRLGLTPARTARREVGR